MFRFSIRDVLWLTVVVGLGLGWCVHARQLEQSFIADMVAFQFDRQSLSGRIANYQDQIQLLKEELARAKQQAAATAREQAAISN